MSEPLLEVRNLKKYFPVQHGMFSSGKGFVHAVDGVSLTVEKGETFGLVGESGCGKSSLSRVILSLVKRDSGDILYKGKDVSALSRSERAKMRMVFQNPFASLNPKERVFDAIAEPYRIAGGYSRAQIQEEVLKLMDLVGLSRGYAARYPHEFSGGQRQRIGIARALAMNPEFIVCDEPVSALDVSIQAQILNLLRDIQKELGGNARVVATGGMGRMMASYCDLIDEVDPNLTLEGLRLIYENNRQAFAGCHLDGEDEPEGVEWREGK